MQFSMQSTELMLFIYVGVTYVRWGTKECPKGVDMVYTGNSKKMSILEKVSPCLLLCPFIC